MGTFQWTAIALIAGMLGIIGSTDWLLTYCAFSDVCPLALRIADLTVK
jgi:hypothetical protein